MASLKSKVFQNITTTKMTIHTVPNTILNSKISEIIFANKTTNEVSYFMFIRKVDGTEVTVMPESLLHANESHRILTSTFLTAGDSVSVKSSENNAIDVMLSYVEL